MNNNIKCTCGHSWSKASSSGKDMNVCHICGKDNTMKNGGWLNKYEQGGMVLDQQPDDNYGKKPNPNDVQASVGPDFVGLGYDTTGRNYSPAWGGQFAMGGALPGAVGFTYARTQNPAPSNGKYAKKTKASAQDGLLMNFEPEKMRSDATRVAPAVRPLTKKEQEENARINKENQKKTEERDKKIVAERQANKNTKGDLSTPGSWHTADKLRLFPSSVGGVGEMFDEYVNPAYVVGSLTDQLGESVARRDIGGAAATLAMTAGLGALGVDPLGDVMKAQRWSQGAVDRLGYNVQTAGPRLGSSTRSLESATAAERSQQQLDLIRQQRRSEAVSRGSQSTRAPYQFPTDEELAIMNAREAERYAPRVSRQSTGTPEDMTALDRFERIQQVDPGPSYAELMEYPSARRVSHSDQMIDQLNQSRNTLSGRVDSQAESAQQAAMNDIRRDANFPVDATNPNSVVHSNNPTLTYERLNRRIDALRTSGISDDIIAQDVQYLREGRPMRSLSQLRGAPGSVPRPPEVRTGPTEKQWSPENFRIGEGNDAGKFRTAHPEGHNIYEDIDISPINNSIDRRYKIVDKDKSMNYVEVKTSQDAGDPYVDVNDISFFNRDPNSSSKQMNIVFSHLPKQARISPISTSVHSQPLLNTRIAKLTSGQPGRIKIEPNEYMGTLNKITRNEGFSPLAWYDETVEQFPKLERTYETLNKYTGSNLQMPYIKFQGQKLPFEEFNTPEFRRLVENNPSLLGDADVMVNKYKTIKNWKNGGQIVDSMGQWAHPGKTTTIPGNDITMKGVNYDVLGVSNTGDKKLMKPGKNYKFDGDYVTEYPKGGWLNKYK